MAAIPADLADKVAALGSEVSAADIDTYAKYRDIEHRATKITIILNSWEKQQSQDRDLRRGYAKVILWALFAQMAVATAALFFLGFGLMTLPEWVASVFFTAVFTEIVAMTMVVLRYLFPPTGTEVLNLIQQL